MNLTLAEIWRSVPLWQILIALAVAGLVQFLGNLVVAGFVNGLCRATARRDPWGKEEG